MHKLLTVITICWMTSVFAAETSPIGYWKTIDHATGRPNSVIKISQDQNHILTAKIVKLLPPQKNTRSRVGMIIVSGLKATENQWTGGHILNPENGKTYKCAVRLTENGKKLNVRGYVGLPLFGRSQIWEKVDLMSG